MKASALSFVLDTQNIPILHQAISEPANIDILRSFLVAHLFSRGLSAVSKRPVQELVAIMVVFATPQQHLKVLPNFID